MTEAEVRIVEYLMASNASRPSDLPDWVLAHMGADEEGEPSHELITAVALMYVRRGRPWLTLEATRTELVRTVSEQGGWEALSGRVSAFRVSCCLERLRRIGRVDQVWNEDPFDLSGVVSVTLSESEWRERHGDSTGSVGPAVEEDPSRN